MKIMTQKLLLINRTAFLFFVFACSFQQALFSQDSSMSIIIHQEINFKSSPQKIYQILLSSTEFSACTKKSFDVFSEKSATIDSSIGGYFSVFDGHIIGRIIELVPNQRIVETWRVVDWPAGKYSIAKFDISETASGAHLSFENIGFPEGLKAHLAIGWQEHYWDAINNYLKSK